jgi:hypothetical protein
MSGAITRFFNDLQVFDVEGYTKVRVGRQCDGGYVVLDDLCHDTTLYSYGIGDDISFEEDYARRYNARVRCFDHTIDGIKTEDSRIKWVKRGLGNGRNCRMPVQDVPLSERTERVLKVDVEHNEWDWLARWGPGDNWSQIIIELHVLPVSTTRPHVPYLKDGEVVTGELSPYFTGLFAKFDEQVNDYVFSLYARGLARLLHSHRVFHVHGNNSLPKVRLEGHEWPQLLELSLVRNDTNLKFTPTKETFPVPGLDFPNKINRPDFTSILPFKCTT